MTYRIITSPYDGYLFYSVQRKVLGLFWMEVSAYLDLDRARKDLACLKATGRVTSYVPTVYYE